MISHSQTHLLPHWIEVRENKGTQMTAKLFLSTFSGTFALSTFSYNVR